MTDATQPAIDMAAIMQRFSQWEADAAKLVPENKARLFACLASAGITLVTVTFDGYGDSGQIEDVAAFIGDQPAELPGGTVDVMRLDHGADQPVANHLSPSEAIEDLAYDLLRQTHCGWENNDGAYGEFTFDVTAGTITLDYNERYTASETYAHEW
ncbi:DUF6878 family protein [Sphingopyxis indica]|uniref:DUF6878 domain-containing protein n=1 Tax=Sphingopyxis indica TaxID=436663 RepID=A0A239IMT2_9SPHN|nr:DUF6878 family protein [Sphingopyxis indica]SNS94869.1 hypothetical protein SAMN06295955_10870 [Sphingopyxis indica]